MQNILADSEETAVALHEEQPEGYERTLRLLRLGLSARSVAAVRALPVEVVREIAARHRVPTRN
jgi:hypothetical protein